MGTPRWVVVVVAGLAGGAVLEQLVAGRGAAVAVAALTCVVPLLIGTSRWAWMGAACSLVLLSAWGFLSPEIVRASFVPFPALLVAAGSLGARTGEQRTRPVTLLPVVVAVASLVYASGYVEDLAFVPLGAATAFFVARTVTRDARGTRRLAEHAGDLAEGRDRVVLDAVAHERAEIARELHDVIAHGINVISLQVGAARLSLPGGAARALQALDAAEAAGAEAIGDLHRLTSVLMDEADDRHGPQPRLADLEQLVLRTRETGLDVRLSVWGEPAPLTLGLELVIYRLVQEALTNVLKHAGRTGVEVTLRYVSSHVHVEVANEVAGVSDRPGSRHGMIGMRERVALYGGTLSVGAGGGMWRVCASLPTEPI